LHTGSEFTADEIEDIFGRGLRAAGRLIVIPLGNSLPRRRGRDARRGRGQRWVDAPFVVAIGTSNRARTFPTWSGRSARSRLVIPTSGS